QLEEVDQPGLGQGGEEANAGGPDPLVDGLRVVAGDGHEVAGAAWSFGCGASGPDAGGRTSPSWKRDQRKGARSHPTARPSRTAWAITSPTAGECLKPWPLHPKSATRPRYSAIRPSRGS